jgi:NTP pyrophosphatase (non-canonical NTP hydrolase)
MTDEQPKWNDGLHFLMNQANGDSLRWFPNAMNVPFLALALGGEVGEVQNIVKKVMRGSTTIDEVKEHLAVEIVDVLIYLVNLMGCEEFKDVNWMDVWYEKRAFNEERFGQ